MQTLLPSLVRRALALLALVLLNAHSAAQVGLQRLAAADTDAAELALLWYPTASRSEAQRFGPFQVQAAVEASVLPGRRPLLLVSHGAGSHELGHAWLAQGMVERGWIVLTMRHTGDNFRDRSGITRADFFAQRARQLSRVLDQLLADPAWRDRIDANRIAAFGHSAGGHSVLALAGARPDLARVAAFCAPDGVGRREDAVMCSLGGRRSPESAAAMFQAQPIGVADARVRAAVVAAPLVLPLQPESLKSLRAPVWVEAAGRDEVLAPKHHAQTLCGQPGVACHHDAAAGHFASFQFGTGPLPADGIDPAFDPPGFDRAAWQGAALQRIAAFLADQVR